MAAELSWSDVGVAAVLLAINAVVSFWLRLRLQRAILVSAVRLTVQLALLGLVLKQIFELATPLPVMSLAAAMTIIAGFSRRRANRSSLSVDLRDGDLLRLV